MGKLPTGIDGDMIGSLGNHVGRRVNGENIISMKPAKTDREPTVLQYEQRLRFGLVTSWLRKALAVLDIGFKHSDVGNSPYNAAVSYNVLHAVTGVSPNFSINYAEAQFSQGDLKKPSNVSVEAGADAAVTYSWTNMTGILNSSSTDQIGVVVYNASQAEFVMLLNVAARSVGEYELQLPLDWIDDVVESWLLAVSVDGKAVSDSAYVGQITVVA